MTRRPVPTGDLRPATVSRRRSRPTSFRTSRRDTSEYRARRSVEASMRFVFAAILLTTLARPQDAPPRDLATLLPRGTSIFVDSEGLSDAAARLKGSALFAGVEGEARARIDAVLGEIAAMKVSRAAL